MVKKLWIEGKLINIFTEKYFEHYRVIYMWKILEKVAPNCGIFQIEGSEKTRLGRRLEVPKVNGSSKTNKLKEQAFQINGAKIFNILPTWLRNQSMKSKQTNLCVQGPEDFKAKLDQYLSEVPDQPRIDGLSPGVENNSLLHQTKRGQGGGQLLNSGA